MLVNSWNNRLKFNVQDAISERTNKKKYIQGKKCNKKNCVKDKKKSYSNQILEIDWKLKKLKNHEWEISEISIRCD